MSHSPARGVRVIQPYILLLLSLLALLFCSPPTAAQSDAAVDAYDVEGSVRVPGGSPSHTRLVLTGANQTQFITSLQPHGHFVIRDVPAGLYVLEVHNVHYTFPSYRIDISSVKNKISVSLHTPTSTLSPTSLPTRVPYPLSIHPLQSTGYFTPREPFNPMSLLKQPMALMLVAMLVMTIVVPRMMGGMSEEEKREMAKMQSSMSITGLMKNVESKVNSAAANRRGD